MVHVLLAALALQASIGPVSRGQLGASWHPGCPVAPAELRLVRVPYWGFDGSRHAGALVVRATVAGRIAAVFERLYRERFPIRRIAPAAAYGGSDGRSMAADNTSAFNCRRVEGSSHWSDHAFGAAIDLNPVENPYVTGTKVAPRGSWHFATLDRSAGAHVPRGTITADDVVVRAFAAIGWEWGGTWSHKDYQHFVAAGWQGGSA
jgi:poly-gamma-glutamate synthesis protein (capsule biosynthesis protein)